jgi:hypothetical protein
MQLKRVSSMGHNLKLGEGLAIGVSFYLAKTREQAIREMLPYYEEHVKMFAPLGFVPGITPGGITSGRELVGLSSAFYKSPVAVAFEHQVRYAPDVDRSRVSRRGGCSLLARDL